jgi:hypothetical protein
MSSSLHNRPGEQTSEYKLATKRDVFGLILAIIGVVQATGGAFLQAISEVPGIDPKAAWIAGVGTALVLLAKVREAILAWKSGAYTKHRTDLKKAIYKETQP